MEVWLIFIWYWMLGAESRPQGQAAALPANRVYVYDEATVYKTARPLPVVGDTTKTCRDCHDDLLTGETVHGPVKKDCARCHQPLTAEHPQEGRATFALTNAVPALCYECHDPNDKATIHDPVQKGDCFRCHDVHNSPNLYLVKTDPVGPICLDCHELDIPEGNLVHGAVSEGNCTGCHHPHQSDYDHLMYTNKLGRLCRKCHKSIRKELKREFVHEPFGQKQCFDCHNGHSSKEAHLSDYQPADLCLSCHDDMHNTLANARVVHETVRQENACLSCHSPHATAFEHVLLRKRADAGLCLDCHDRPVATPEREIAAIGPRLAPGNSVHEPIETEGCLACHRPHEAEEHSLLTLSFPATKYAPATPGNFELCFQCHDKAMLSTPVTTTLTGFRDDNENLHYLHTQGERGRNCSLCHDMHGSPNPYLIKEKTQYGSWLMPIEFEHNDRGGSCLTGCHERKYYEREILPDSVNIPDGRH